jgi:hypothetical protein
MKKRILIVGALVLSGTAMSSLATPSTARGFVGDSGSGWDTTSAVSANANAQHGTRTLLDSINGNGILAAGDKHVSSDPDAMWLSSGVDTATDDDRFAGTPAGPWAEYDLGSDVSLADMHIWNYGEGSWPSWGKQGLQDVEIYYTTTGGGGLDSQWGSDTLGDWTSLGGPRTLNADMSGSCCGHVEDYSATDIIAFGGATARYVIVLGADGAANYNFTGGSNNDGGLAEVRFYPVPEPASLALVGLGALALLRRRRMK